MAVLFNGRTAIHRLSQGRVTTTSINRTPPNATPITFPSIAHSQDGVNGASKVFVNHECVLHQQSYFAVSHGDETGTLGGIYSGTVGGPAHFITGSPNIFIEGIPVVRDHDLMVTNHRNSPAAPLQQPGSLFDEHTPSSATQHPASGGDSRGQYITWHISIQSDYCDAPQLITMALDGKT